MVHPTSIESNATQWLWEGQT